jgi:hypothetical protein
MSFEKQHPVNDNQTGEHLLPNVSDNSAMQCVHQALVGSCRYALICIVEKATALAKDKGIFFQSITKSGLKFCQ